MDSQMISLVERLVSIQIELGPSTYRRAMGAAYQAVARVALDEAESQAGVIRLGPSTATVIPFPLSSAHDPNRRGTLNGGER